jgi:exo-beta-1,3-glucanase (GH17 family)
LTSIASVSQPRTASLASFAFLWLCSAAGVSAAPANLQCQSSRAVQPALTRLRDAMAHGRFTAYQPISLRVVDGRFTDADADGIRADLTQLRARFDALITYDAIHGAQQIPAIAARLKFRALIIGVWDPADEAQLDAALEAARRFPQLVVGVSLGNEVLFAHRSDPARLLAAIARVRARAPQLALSTSEPFHVYDEPAAAAVLGRLDFLLPIVHPVFQPWFRDAPDSTAAQFVVNVLGKLTPLACGPILVKETGVPTAPESAGFSEARQAAFYRELRRVLPPSRTQAFAYFAAYDAPWRAYDATGVPRAPAVHPEEAHWGLYDEARRPKAAARELPPLPP